MDSRTVLARSRILVSGSEDDSLARAALAVQQSECGAARRIDAIIAALKDLPAPRVSPINVNTIRAIVMKETGLSIERDDPFLLVLIATQDIGLNRLEKAVEEMKQSKELKEEILEIILNKWVEVLGVIAAIGVAFNAGLYVAIWMSRH